MEETLPSQTDINLKAMMSISKQKLGNVVRASYPQDLTGCQKSDSIIDNIFGTETVLSMDKITDKIINSVDARQLI